MLPRVFDHLRSPFKFTGTVYRSMLVIEGIVSKAKSKELQEGSMACEKTSTWSDRLLVGLPIAMYFGPEISRRTEVNIGVTQATCTVDSSLRNQGS